MANNYVWENVLRRLHLPVQYFDNHFSIYEKYQNERVQFEKTIDQVDNYTDDSNKNEQVAAAICRIKEISNHVFDAVGDIILSYENADMIHAYSLFDSLMESIEHYLLISTIDGIYISDVGNHITKYARVAIIVFFVCAQFKTVQPKSRRTRMNSFISL